MGNSREFALARKAQREAALVAANNTRGAVRSTIAMIKAHEDKKLLASLLTIKTPSDVEISDMHKAIKDRGPAWFNSIADWIKAPCPDWFTTDAPNIAFKTTSLNSKRGEGDKRDIDTWSRAQVDAFNSILADTFTWREIHDGDQVRMVRWIHHPVNAAYMAMLVRKGNAIDLLDSAAAYVKSASASRKKGVSGTDSIELGAMADVDAAAKKIILLAADVARAYDAMDRATLKASTTFAADDKKRADAKESAYADAVSKFYAAWRRYHGVESLAEISAETPADAPTVDVAVSAESAADAPTVDVAVSAETPVNPVNPSDVPAETPVNPVNPSDVPAESAADAPVKPNTKKGGSKK